MSNLNSNRINVTMTEQEVENIKGALTTALKNMEFLIGLTTQERQSIPKINVSNKVFVEDAINAGVNTPVCCQVTLQLRLCRQICNCFTS